MRQVERCSLRVRTFRNFNRKSIAVPFSSVRLSRVSQRAHSRACVCAAVRWLHQPSTLRAICVLPLHLIWAIAEDLAKKNLPCSSQSADLSYNPIQTSVQGEPQIPGLQTTYTSYLFMSSPFLSISPCSSSIEAPKASAVRRTHSEDIKERVQLLEKAISKANYTRDTGVAINKNHPEYGTPQKGTWTEIRGQKAHSHVHKVLLLNAMKSHQNIL